MVEFNVSHVSNRGYKKQLTHIHYNICKRLIFAMWNSLPEIIVSAESTNTFKNRLVKFWIKSRIQIDFRADIDITGVGSRNINSLTYV